MRGKCFIFAYKKKHFFTDFSQGTVHELNEADFGEKLSPSGRTAQMAEQLTL